MEKTYKYYNQTELEEIFKLKNERKLHKAIQKFRKYIKKYPNDTCALTSFASFLVDLGFLDEASEILQNIVISNRNIEKKIDITELIFTKIKLLGAQRKYKECYQLVLENEEALKSDREDYYSIVVFLKKKIGIPLDEKDKSYSYTTSQIAEYSEKSALEHIIKHSYSKKEERTLFNPSFNVEEWYYKIREMLPLENYEERFSGIFKNMYVFKYLDCGIIPNSEQKLNFIKVIALQDSNEIITMYPYDNIENTPFVDITPVMENTSNEKQNVKRMSQIDKFNKRYGI